MYALKKYGCSTVLGLIGKEELQPFKRGGGDKEGGITWKGGINTIGELTVFTFTISPFNKTHEKSFTSRFSILSSVLKKKKKKNLGKPFTVKSKMFAVIMQTNSIDNQEN